MPRPNNHTESGIRVRLFNTHEPVTTFYRDLIPGWVGRGWQVDVVISKAQYRAGRDRAWAVDGVRLLQTPGLGIKPKHPLAKVTIMLFYVLGAVIHSLLRGPVDVNLFLTQPPLLFAWGYVLQRLRGQPYVVVLMDIYPDIAVQAGALSGRSSFTRLLARISGFALRKADGVIVIGRCMAERVRQMGVAREQIYLVPNWTDQEQFGPVSTRDNSFRRQQGWNGKFVVLYSGNIGVSHYFDDILEAARRLRTRTDLQFAFVGDGLRRQEITRFKEDHGLDNISLLPFQSMHLLPLSLAAGDLHFVSLRRGFEGVVVPSKTYGALAAGRPILYQGDEGGEIARLIAENDVGAVVPPGRVDDLTTTILRYAQDAALVETQGRHARRLVEAQFSKEKAIARYTEILKDLSRVTCRQ